LFVSSIRQTNNAVGHAWRWIIEMTRRTFIKAFAALPLIPAPIITTPVYECVVKPAPQIVLKSETWTHEFPIAGLDIQAMVEASYNPDMMEIWFPLENFSG
jgi:hypothetical protein